MNRICAERMTARIDGELVVFLIGMRINRLWKVHKWLPVARAMPRMIRELSTQREHGFLGVEQWFGNPTLMLQYWRSFEALERYAKNRSAQHLPEWAAFNRAVVEVEKASSRLLSSLVTAAPPKNREIEAAKAHARAERRFGPTSSVER